MGALLVRATRLTDGTVMALPMGRTATIDGAPKVGTTFVTFRTEHGPTRVRRDDEVLVEEGTPLRPLRCSACGGTEPHHLAYVAAHGQCVV